MRYYFFLLLFVSSVGSAQKLKKEDRQLLSNLQQHVKILSADIMEGRRTGTPGEKLAAEYIGSTFKNMGIAPKGRDGYYQSFFINDGKQVNPATHLIIDGHNLMVNKEYFPLPYSSSSSLEAMPSVALQEANEPWFFNISELLESNKTNPHFDLHNAILSKSREMQKKGATAIFLYNTSSIDDKLVFNPKDKSEALSIPVVYIIKEAAKKYLHDDLASLDVKLKVDLGLAMRTGRNVIGYIDNGAARTVVIGAHFDHLGYGEDGGSLLANKTKKEIHNGADDNASGTAALLEIARRLKSSKTKTSNYLFIAFSGEELGLFGSKYFVDSPTINLSSVNYMINLDMVGRLNDSSKTVTVGGYGTTPTWGQLYSMSGKNRLYDANLNFRFDSSGTGPSDHTSFYRKDIPVLFYFTGLHSDYHKPTDDYEKINFNGQMHLVKHILSLVENAEKQPGKLLFNKTREVQMASASFSVTLGIMPDYTFSGEGVRLDGVSENRPAQKIGMKAGDVIISLDDFKTVSVESYMKALSQFKKGDKAKVVYKRGGETFSSIVEF
jgi:aminopeptidase YwaD